MADYCRRRAEKVRCAVHFFQAQNCALWHSRIFLVHLADLYARQSLGQIRTIRRASGALWGERYRACAGSETESREAVPGCRASAGGWAGGISFRKMPILALLL